MPPKRNAEDVQTLKEKLQNSSTNARGRRTGGTQAANGSSLKEVDNASTNSGQTSSDLDTSNQSSLQMKWTSQEPAVLQGYRRAYRLDTPSTFKNPLSHVVLGQGIGRMSPTMARAKSKRRVHKDQLAMAVRKNFNALGVTESDVIVDWLYKTKHQDKEFRVRFTPQRK
ncbi:hypothetical protein EKO04_007770 [Ascochyta lentis]|uniref:Histone deacetylase complex subunit SAP30 Sin3 binding domain-containing protein n=1 Tax=Ascochyta lentis TaxID=205686 RepID=A0A8H7IZK3_9PLEO|nr:hypothetical protein EKO04_007770 [Ascochyta lentis]